ncbi:hypothetical protein BDV96DRAFT_567060 [Lophiotrema nucula]|uniref:Uncharacterized protein n=1 Tax=Lophiotrema nucula TaxID=690887 RepID=A0A6A5ZN85_9PLEO|nr:hypothetical protein BDV96DRAFT_567060 [Lophiotrema nucula]
MSEHKQPFVDAAKQAEGGYVDVTQKPQKMSKEDEARAESSRNRDAEGLSAPPPSYGESASANAASHLNAAPPPNYKSLQQDVADDMRALMEGDPNETISVPMIHSTDRKSLKNMIFREVGKVSQTVIVRKMPRGWYVKHYAKDSEGNYIGTEKPAADAGLVFVPSKSTPEEILQQVRQVAFGKEHYNSDFGSSFSGLAGGAFVGGGGGGF